MIRAEITVGNPLGLHLIPANKVANEAERFQSKITFRKGEMQINAKSILSIISGSFHYKDTFICECQGDDEKEALAAMKKIVETDFQ